MNASRITSLVGLLLAIAIGSSTHPAAAGPCLQNCGPPLGSVLDLSGQPLPVNDPTSYTFDVTASADATSLSFVFRDDFAYIDFYNVELFDTTTSPTTELLTNGTFSSQAGVYTSGGNPNIPKGWDYTNLNSSSSDAFVTGGYSSFCVVKPGSCYVDGTADGYDELSEPVTIVSGDTYKISFIATVTAAVPPPSLPPSNVQPNAVATWLRTSTNDGTVLTGNGVDIAAYFGSPGGLTKPPIIIEDDDAPEPSTWVMMLLGFGGLGFLAYRRARAHAV